MGNSTSIKKINFEDMQYCVNTPEKFIIINTLNENSQECLIHSTILASNEVEIINEQIENPTKCIVIYGKNCTDEKVEEKYKQIVSLGLYNLCIYTGGLFEWLCLQDIYGDDEFKTTSNKELLDYKPEKKLISRLLLTN
jgi:hypothetical protein